MFKVLVAVLFILLVACDSESEETPNLIGIVADETSCNGGIEPVFIIKLGEKDSIITATLPDEFQIPNLNIQFKTKESSFDLFCTSDKIYPEDFDVFDVILFSD